MNSANVFHLVQPDLIDDPLTDVLCDSASRLLAAAIEAEVAAHLAAYQDLKLPDGRQRLVRHRTKRTKDCLSRDKTRVMVFKLIKAAEKNWLRLRGLNQLPKVIDGIKFEDGDQVMPIADHETQTAA